MLKVMTFNVRGAFSDDGDNIWQERAALNVAVIRKHSPDVLGFQELHAANLKTYQHQLSSHDYFLGQPYDFKERHAYNAIFWRRERFNLLASGSFYLSQTPERPWSTGWDAALPRTAVWLKLLDKQTNLSFLLINTHLDHRGVQARKKSGELIRQRAAELSQGILPIILTGDFNANPWLPAPLQMPDAQPDTLHQGFLSSGFQDCFLAAGNIDSLTTHTFHGYQGARYEPRQFHMALRIDWILVQDHEQRVKVHACQIVRDSAPPRYPSDHYPLIAELLLNA